MSWLCLWTVWKETLLVRMRFLRTQIREPQIWEDWKCSRLLPLVALALRGPQKALQWLLFQLLRYSFCTICWTGIQRLALTLHEHKRLFFPHRLALHHLLCYHIDFMWQLSEGTSWVFSSSLCDSLFDLQLRLWSGTCSKMCCCCCCCC